MKEQKEALNTLPQQSGAGSPAPRVFLCHLPGLRHSLNTLPWEQANPAHQEPKLGLYAQAEDTRDQGRLEGALLGEQQRSRR